MNQTKVRKTIEMDMELSDDIQKMADEKKWSHSYMSYVLLQQAVKEKKRKRKNDPQEQSNS